MNIEYLERGKEEIDLANTILKQINDKNVVSLIDHLVKSMGFISDFLNNRHVEFETELAVIKEFMDENMGKEFLEMYFYLLSLKKKDFRVLNSSQIIISGRNTENVDKNFFKNLTKKVIAFFNNAYELAEQGVFLNNKKE